MTTVKLVFPLTNGGQESGFNDSGVETFLGHPLYYIARECGQNVGDVTRKDVTTVELHFQVVEMPTDSIPCIDQLKDAFDASLKFWEKDPKGNKFFREAIAHASQPTVAVLKISDYGTTGLKGKDDERNGGWYGLVRSAGVTNKFAGDEGGGFGIGKYATFAGSGFRTVLYSTLTDEGVYGFQGVSHLVSHLSNNRTTQGTGYIGYYDERELRFSALRKQDEIPPQFLRTEVGLDIYILDFQSPKDWKTPLLQSILENFWPAIYFNKIRFKVGDAVVDQQSLEQFMNQFASNEDFDAYYHYQSVASEERKQFSRTLNHLGEVKLFLVKGWNERFPKSIARVRKPGMVIDKRNTRSRVPYAGLFVCDNPIGNKLLKQMEPPRHDEFQPERAPQNGQAAINELNKWLVECVKSLNPALNSKTLDIPHLHRYLPDTKDEIDALEDTNANTERQESFGQSIPRDPPEVHTSTPLAVHTVRLETQDEDGTDGTDGSGGNEEDAPSGDGGGGVGGSGSSEGADSGNDDGEGGGSAIRGENRYIELQSRTFDTGDPDLPICLCLRTSRDFEGSLILSAVGEDGGTAPLEVSKAALDGEQKTSLVITGENEIRGIRISKDSPTRVKIAIPHNYRFAIKVTGRRK